MSVRWTMVIAAVSAVVVSTPAAADGTLCRQLVALFDRHTNYRSTSTGPYLPRRVAAEECRKGNTHVGIPMMEGALDRHRIERGDGRLEAVSFDSQ
jgi:hypothetical protein